MVKNPSHKQLKQRGQSAITRTKASDLAERSVCNVLQYDVSSNTIHDAVKRKTESLNNPLLAQLASKKQPGFSSMAPRW